MRTTRAFLLAAAILTATVATPSVSQTADEAAVAAQSAKQIRWLVERNVNALAASYHDRMVILHAEGMPRTKEQTLEGLRAGQPIYNSINVLETSVRVAGTTAVLIGKAHYLLTVNGEQRPYDRIYTEVYVHEDGKWLLFSRQAAAVPQATPTVGR